MTSASDSGEFFLDPAAIPPVVHGRYLPLGVVGEGASTRVYHAYDTFTGRDVALQILRRDPALEPIRHRFLTATRPVLTLQHPAVVSCFEAGETEAGDPYVVMELLRGETLGDRLARGGPLPWSAAVPLFLDAAAGLAAIHEAGLVHRDVKPDNLFLVGPPGAPERLKVLDFGLAMRLDSGEETGELVVGTTEYMPPEQVLCDPVDARSDVYSLGAVLFRALTGELPFGDVRRNQTLAHHLMTPAPPPSWLVEDLPAALGALIQTALRKHPDNRFATMRELHAALERIALGFEACPCCAPPLRLDPDRYEPRGARGSAALRALGAALAA